ncbi:MAG: hypothetical protein V7K42_28345 [Nostoc sp.]
MGILPVLILVTGKMPIPQMDNLFLGKPHWALAYQQTSLELMQMGCLLTVFVPFETACTLLEKLTGVKLSTAAL